MTIRSRTIPVSAIAAAVCASLVASSAWAGTGQKTSGTHECHGSAVDPKGDCLAHGDPGALLKLTDASLYDLANAMKPAQGRPNELSRIAGQMAYLRQDYAAAITQFERGAHYADKFSQHVLSLMHWHGIGVDPDPVQAYIWADLAAERGSNVMLLIREKMWSGLTPVQQELAGAERVVGGIPAGLIRRHMHAVQPQLAPPELGVGLLQAHLARPHGLHLGPREHQATLPGLEDMIVMTGLGVAGEKLSGFALRRRWSRHGVSSR